MASSLITPVIICGGSGTRLWPLSRESQPKQFIPLGGDTSTFQQVLARVADPGIFAPPIVVTNTEFRFTVADQLQRSGVSADIILEPVAAIPVPPLRSRPNSPAGATRKPSCWSSPPIISCTIPGHFAARASTL